MTSDLDFDPTLAGVAARRRAGATPADEWRAAQDRIARWNDPALFIHLASAIPEQKIPDEAAPGSPLAGAVCAIKDNIDVAGMPTTAGCPSYAFTPTHDAPAVARLRAAGAIPIGKTNLDQFATGLVGTRSPHGCPRNPHDPTLIPGGSSSGSAVAVAAGLVPVALGTDTAGSGRVPAAFTGIVGIKPTRGWISTRAVVPAVRSLDCVSVFAHTVADAWKVTCIAGGFDAEDQFSREPVWPALTPGPLRIGAPDPAALGDCDGALITAWRHGLDALQALGHTIVPVDPAPFFAAANLLYGGAWVAERTAAVGAFLDRDPPGADPVVAGIIRGGYRHDAVAAWRGTYELARLRRLADAAWTGMDVLCLPTTPTHPSLAAVRGDPLGVNARLGRFTNFANLLDTCAIAIPAGLTPAGRPAGLTLFAPAWHDAVIARLAATVQAKLGLPLGATGRHAAPEIPALNLPDGGITVAVFGAHLRGQPLNKQLLANGGRFVADCRTAPTYRCHLLVGPPDRPALVRSGPGGAAIPGELWHLPAAGFGRLTAAVFAPLAIGNVTLDDGRTVKGFVCEEHGAEGTPDITRFGGWRGWLASQT